MNPTGLSTNETLTFVLAHLPAPHSRILDVGCGSGAIASRLQAHGHEVVAIDESAEAVQQASALGVSARVAAWPAFTDAPFDAILFARSLHHIHPLAEAVKQAYRLLVPSGLVIVDEFAWTELDPATTTWFYELVRLLDTCKVLSPKAGTFVNELLQSNGDFTFWQHSHDHDLHPAMAMGAALQTCFQPVSQTNVPYLYRYLCQALPENEAGYAIAAQVFQMEQRLAQLGMISLIGRRFVGRKLLGS